MKMPVPNGILSVYDDLIISFKCEDDTVDLNATSACIAVAMVMVAQVAKIDPTSWKYQSRSEHQPLWTPVPR
jgi:hypothetical protein